MMKLSSNYKVLKSIIDFIAAGILLFLLMPILFFLGIFVYLHLGSPILFIQIRPGLNEKLFKLYKFRTMSMASDKSGNFLPDHQRLSTFGKFLRSSSLDELPSLWNVLRGDMSFVGPRPLLEEYIPLYSENQKRRHEVKPGITGWAQVNGRNAISWEKKFELDVWYVDHISFLLDVKILFQTIIHVILRKNIHAPGEVTAQKFTGNLNNQK